MRKSAAKARDLPPWLLTARVFSASTTAVVMLRSAGEQRKGGEIPRGTVKGMLFLTMERETQAVLHRSTVTTINRRQISQI